jgi:hypothetical protein
MFMSTPIRRIRSPCCARAASGQVAAPPSSVMNSRLVIVSSAFKDLRCQSAPKARIAILSVSAALSKRGTAPTTIPAKKTPRAAGHGTGGFDFALESTNMTPGNILIIPGKVAGKDDLERARGLRAAACFRQMLAAAKAQLDAVNWYALGLAEAEAALEAWQTGGQHGFFDIWEQRRGEMGRNRPAPSSTELRARRMAILFCIALERGGLNRHAARKFAARELEHAGVFATAPSHRTIERPGKISRWRAPD